MANPKGNPHNPAFKKRQGKLMDGKTASERKEIGRKGAKASNASQASTKAFKEILIELANKAVKNNENSTVKDAIGQKLIEKAVSKGDLKAIEMFIKYIGEEPAQKQDVISRNINEEVPPNKESLQRLEKMLKK